MFTKIYQSILSALLISTFAIPMANAADEPVKREMRGTWIATVYRLDWPPVVTSGNESTITRQKDAMIALLDSMATNNLNSVNFQVRSRCDAMYVSSYEPWSSDLVTTRGMDPGWDPLEFVVEECHKRGLECNAWVNPYRYETVLNQWDGTPKCYREEHPEWLMDHDGQSILNPALPEVTQRIVDVVKEIIQNYDVDGVLFDDYFYLSGTPYSDDAEMYNAYKDEGGTLAQDDWRRENVNDMIAEVYSMIQEVKPWVRFGISPAGIACTTPAHARIYDVSMCPSGSDWQYSDIYSDPLAWISRHSLDFISPQVYWTIGYSSGDFSLIVPWWAEVVKQFDRHNYTSISISSLTASSKSAGLSLLETSLQERANTKASGPNNTSYEEFANEIRITRESALDDAPGSLFYSSQYLYNTSPLFSHYLKTTVYNTHALAPLMDFKISKNPGNISDLTLDGNELSWSGFDNVRYTVYAFPNTIPTINFNNDPEYLLGVTYSESYTIPDSLLDGYTFAVCVFDRYCFEYSATFLGIPNEPIEATTLIYPEDDTLVETPFEFTWNAVDNAKSYVIEVALDDDFDDMLYTIFCNTPSCSSNDLYDLPIDTKMYWRVRTSANGYEDNVSESRAVTVYLPKITSPVDGTTDMSLTPTITWDITDGRDVTVEIATDNTFSSSTLIFSAVTNEASLTVPEYTLNAYTTYYVRVCYEWNGESITTAVVEFKTLEMEPDGPQLVFPTEGGDFYSEDYLSVTPVEGLASIRYELDSSESFAARSCFIETCSTPSWQSKTKAGDMKVSSKNLQEGTLYYIRVRGAYNAPQGSLNTDWSTIVSAYYRGDSSGLESIDSNTNDIQVINGELHITRSIGADIMVKAYTPAGVDLGVFFDGTVDSGKTVIPLDNLEHGIYIIIVNQPEGIKALKAII